jgi:hypothetical protein
MDYSELETIPRAFRGKVRSQTWQIDALIPPEKCRGKSVWREQYYVKRLENHELACLLSCGLKRENG